MLLQPTPNPWLNAEVVLAAKALAIEAVIANEVALNRTGVLIRKWISICVVLRSAAGQRSLVRRTMSNGLIPVNRKCEA